LLYQAQRCEDSLHAARVELATIRAGNTKTSVDSVIQALEEKIKQVKEVQDELTRMGY
jgi:vacuolar-type H+-ATPase subunit E/Vma4